jgi:uncharacterized protein (TIGR01777 family)
MVGSSLRIAIAGSSGFIGQHLTQFLTSRGHQVLRLLRAGHSNQDPGTIFWDPQRGYLDAKDLAGVDGVVNLCGEGVASKRWTAERKLVLRESRIRPTALLAQTIARMAQPPRVFASVSAVGFYGLHGDEPVDETSPAGSDFLSELVVAWETAAQPAHAAGVRVVHPRLGSVLDGEEGMLARLLPAFRSGAGGRAGNGMQVVSWIALDDVLAGLAFMIENPDLRGPINLVSPGAVSNAAFAKTLAAILRRPALIPLPETAVSLVFGEMGRTLLLGGARVIPRRLLQAGYAFLYPELRTALEHLLAA